MKRIFNVLICGFIIIIITGCSDIKDKDIDIVEPEKFVVNTTLDDGRGVHFTFSIPYKDTTLDQALLKNIITIDDFISKLEYYSALNDGGSIIYKYNKGKKIFGNIDFKVIVCNSLDNVNDIYVAKNEKSLDDKCRIKINDLDNITMTIKDGTLSRTGATIIITDKSNRSNIYGPYYRIEKKVGGIYKNEVKKEIYWNYIGYYVDENGVLEMDINWESIYGSLEDGEYRIVKYTSEAFEGTNHYIATEFIIK